MWTQRDQLSAYRFLRRRLVSALQTGDANHPASPSRRVVTTAAMGFGCAVLIAAGFGIYGVVRPGASTDWREPGRVVIEKESGAAFVLGADGALHPVLNYASARLLAGGDGTATATVSSRSLASVPRGAPLGIAGAPSTLPARDRLTSKPWSVCSSSAPDRPADAAPVTTAVLGVPPTGTELDGAQALIVKDGQGIRYAVVDGRRLRIRDAAVSAALGYDGVPGTVVAPAWLSAVPAGADLALVTVDGHGRPGPRIGAQSTVVGQVLVVRTVGSDDRYYVVRTDGLDAVTQTEAALILGNPANRDAYTAGAPAAVAVPAADLGSQMRNEQPAGDYPAKVPQPVAAGAGDRAVACASSDGGDRTSLWLSAAVPPAGGRSVAARGTRDARTADQVYVPPSAGSLVRERQSAGAATGTVYLLTDQGLRYPIANGEAVKALGYDGVTPAAVASSTLALFPVGPALDITAAQKVAS
jgi:type VII secretion protein EccB